MCCCIGGDGAVVAGGAGRKNTTGAAEELWERLHPQVFARVVPDGAPLIAHVGVQRSQRLADEKRLWYPTEWDKMHREDIRLVRAIKGSSAVQELFAVARQMDHMYHFGDGRLLLRSAAKSLGIETYSGTLPGGTRRGVHLTEEPGHLLRNLRAYASALPAKIEHRPSIAKHIIVNISIS